MHSLPGINNSSFTDGQRTVPCNASGSPLYLAPETIMEKQIDCAVDMWSCGVILYLLLVGLLAKLLDNLKLCVWPVGGQN